MRLVRDRLEWQFFRELPKAGRFLAASWWTFVVVRGLLPAAFAVAVGAVVGAVLHGGSMTTPLVALGLVFSGLQLLPPVHTQISANLGDRLALRLNEHLLSATVAPRGMAHLESPALAADLALARDVNLAISGPPLALSVGFVAGGLVDLVAGVGQAALLLGYSWWASLVLAGAWASTHWLLRESTVWDRDAGPALQAQRRAEYTYRLAVDTPAAKEIRLFGLDRWTVDQFAASRRRLVELRLQATRLRQRSLIRALLLVAAANAFVFWRLADDALLGRLDVGAVVVFAQAAVGVTAIAFGGLNWSLPLAAQGVTAVLRLPEKMRSLGQLPEGNRTAEGHPQAEVRFRHVSFAYPGGGPVLNDLNLTIRAGTSLAVVGHNGAGKTTLVKLLCRLYDPSSGSVEVDGIDLRDFELDSWRARVAAVFQDFLHYDLPLRDNVAPLGGSTDEIEAALVASGAGGLRHLDELLGRGYAGGTELSGGQWQRIALARAVLGVIQGAGLVILDEPTAQLDVRAEAEIFERLLEATRGRTTVLISHRFSTVRQADKICVLRDGRVCELGSHDELMAAGGMYRRMFDVQAARFEEERDAPSSS